MGSLEVKKGLYDRLGFKATEGQLPILLDDSRFTLIAGGERSGKAIHIDSRIPTPIGWRTMGELKAGDKVFTDDGTETTITWVSSVQYDHTCYKVVFDTGAEIIADASHLWSVQTEHDRKNTNRKKKNGIEFHVNPPCNIRGRKHSVLTTEELLLNLTLEKPKTKWGCGYMSNLSIPVVSPVEYPEQELPIHPYVLGVWLGDGNSNDGVITIDDVDIETVEKIQKLGYDTYPLKCRFRHRIKTLYKLLRIHNLKNNKHIPQQYLQSSIEQRLELLRGLMDTDGSATREDSEFYNKNEVLIDNVRELLSSLGIKSWKRSKTAKLYGKDCGIAYTLTFSTPLSVFHLARKRDKQNRKPAGHTQNRYIRSVELVKSVPVKCISVSSPSALYLAGDYILTHNSRTATVKALPKLFTGDLFWLVGKEYNAVRAEFSYFVEDFRKLGILEYASTNIDPGEIRFLNGKKIITLPTKDETKIATEAPDGILVAEAAQITYYALLKLMGRLAEKRGWLILEGTFESSLGFYPEYFTRWQGYNEEGGKSFSLPSWTNSAIYEGGRQDPEILRLEEITPHDIFLERYGGLPCPPVGMAIPEFSNKVHVGDYRFRPDIPVEITIDPGYAGAHALEAIQEWDGIPVIVDEVYLQNIVTEDMITIAQQKDWWSLVEGGTIDVAGNQHHDRASAVEVWENRTGFHLRSRKVKEEEGLELLRSYLKVNPNTSKTKLLVDSHCKGFISECGGCQSPVGGGMWMRNVHTNKLIDKDNHATKAVIYYLANKYGYTGKSGRLPVMRMKAPAGKRTFVRT